MKGFPRAAVLPVATGLLAALAFGVQAGVANAAPTTVTATTAISNHADGGHGGNWAYDNFNRTLTVTKNADQTACPGTSGFVAVTDICYSAHIADNGTSSVIVGNLAPNQSTPGVLINHFVKPTMVGSYDLAMYAPSADVLSASGVPASRDDNFGTPATTTTDWPTLALTPNTGAQVAGGAYNWTYTSACEKWVDSSTNGDGNLPADGNITGVNDCIVAHSNVVQVKNRATGKCLNENQANGLLSTFSCFGATYASLRWQVVTYANGTKALMSVQTGKTVRDNGLNAQLTLTSVHSPMLFQSGGIFRFGDGLVIGVNNQGNFAPVIGSPSFSSLDNVRWDFGALS